MSPVIWCVCLNPAIEIAFAIPNSLGPECDLTTAASQAIAAGGKATNVARVLQQLGHSQTRLVYLDAAASTPCSRLFSSLLGDLAKHSIAVAALRDIRTSVVFAVQDSSRTQVVRTDGLAELQSAALLPSTLFEALDHLVPGDWMVCAGSLPANIPSDFYFSLCKFASQRGARVVIDCSGAALRHSLGAGPFLVKVNREEAISLFDSSASEERVAVENLAVLLREHGAALAIVTDGPRQLAWSSISDSGSFQPRFRPPVSATGAGDAFLAAFVVSVLRDKGKAFRHHIEYASEIGSAAVASLSSGHLPPKEC